MIRPDWTRFRPFSAMGRDLPTDGSDYREFKHRSECTAYRVGKACREKLLKGGCCKGTAQNGIQRDNQEIHYYCDTIP